MEGYSLALDFPINKQNLLLLDSLDEITIKYASFYLGKIVGVVKLLKDLMRE